MCDTDGFIDLDELQAALAKAGRPVSLERAQEILTKVDTNNDGQIDVDEFQAVFTLEPGKVPEGLRGLVGVSSFFLDGLGRVGNALGIEASGQWRTTESGSRYVDDVVGAGRLVVAGDVSAARFQPNGM